MPHQIRSIACCCAVFFTALGLLLAAPHGATAADTVKVAVSIEPQRSILRQLLGETAEITVLVPPGASPATFEPSPRQMAALAEAPLYLSIGVPFEAAWLPRMIKASPATRFSPMDAGIQKRMMAAHAHHGGHEHGDTHHEHGHEHEHAEHEHHHGGIPDPHVWLSPVLAKQLAATAAHKLGQVYPELKDSLAANLAAFQNRCDTLDGELREILKDVPKGAPFMVFHPSWGYFAKDYGLTQVAIETEGKEPSPRELAELVEHAREEGIQTVFVQPQFSAKAATAIAKELGGGVARLDPLAPDWDENLRRAAQAIAGSIAQ